MLNSKNEDSDEVFQEISKIHNAEVLKIKLDCENKLSELGVKIEDHIKLQSTLTNLEEIIRKKDDVIRAKAQVA